MRTVLYDGEALHDPRIAGRCIADAWLNLEANSAGTLSFTVYPGHPLHDTFAVMDATREVTVEEDGEELFRGRVTRVRYGDMGEQEVECEGQAAYLNDSVVRPYATYESDDYATTAPSQANLLWIWLITQHNAQVTKPQQFHIGEVSTGSGAITHATSSYPTTGGDVTDVFLDSGMGYLRARYADGKRYIDILDGSETGHPQRIELGVNLTEFANEVSCKSLVTAIIPVSQWPDGDDEHEGDMTLEDYRDGAFGNCVVAGDVMRSAEGVALRGVIAEQRTYEASTPYALACAAYQDLQSSASPLRSLEIGAVDLHNIDPTIRPFRLYDWARVTAGVYGVDQRLMVVAIGLDPTDPTRDKYTLGATLPTLTHSNAVSQRNMQQALESGIQAVTALTDEAKASAQEAQEAADAAATTAASKRRVFLSTPFVPYDEGDLWRRETSDGRVAMWACVSAQDEDGAYDEGDWELSSTDDGAADKISADIGAYGEQVIDTGATVVVVSEGATAAQRAAAEAEAESLGADIATVAADVYDALVDSGDATEVVTNAASISYADFTAIDAQAAAIASMQVAAANADSAVASAAVAAQAAQDAQDSADAAQQSADAAQGSADIAAWSATNALAQLSFVEDVAGTLQWIQDNCSFAASADTEVDSAKVYFALSGGDYIPLVPDGDECPAAEGWYELTNLEQSQRDYIMAHLVVTSRGLWILPSGLGEAVSEQYASGYKMLLSAGGYYIYDSTGALVRSDTSAGTLYSPDYDWYVGSEDAYIFYDASEPKMTIGGTNIQLGSSRTLSQLLAAYDTAALSVVIESSAGTGFVNQSGTTTLTCRVYKYGDTELDGSGTSFSYQWYLDGAAIPGATSKSYGPITAPASTATYKCEVTVMT